MVTEPCIVDGRICGIFSKYPERCQLCINYSNFSPQKEKNKSQSFRKYKKSERVGAKFEENTLDIFKQSLGTKASLTPNSGAGSVKGDIQLKGMVPVYIECKTKEVDKIARGSKTFTIHREWLEKCKKEYKERGDEFWSLIFNFNELDRNEAYAIIDMNELSAWIATLDHDRRIAKEAQFTIDQYKHKNRELELEIIQLKTQVKNLKNECDLLNQIKDFSQLKDRYKI